MIRRRITRASLHGAVLTVYIACALAITFPLVTVWSTHFAGHPFGDSYEIARFMWWLPHALTTGEPLFAQPWLLYPIGLTSWFIWGNPLQVFPGWLFAFAMPLPAAYNLQLVLTLTLNGWAMYALVRSLTGSGAAALIAGAVYLAYPTMQGHAAAGHTGLLAQWMVPLFTQALLMMTPGEQRQQRRAIAAAAIAFALSALGSTQMPIFTTLPVAVFMLVRARHDRRAVRAIVAVLVLGGLLAAVFALPALLETLAAPQRSEGGLVRFSADALAVVTPSPFHPLYGALDYTGHVLGVDPFEGAAYVGLAAGALALIGLRRVRAARAWLVLGGFVWVLSLGPLLRAGGELAALRVDGYPTAVTLPYAALIDVPLLDILRTPGRFNFALALVIAVLAGHGAAWLLTRMRPSLRWATALALIALVLADYQLWWREGRPDLPTIPADIPAPIAALRERSDVRAVFHVPWQHLLVDKDALWLQTGYRRPMIAGHITRRTPLEPARGWLLQTYDPALLDAAGADVIILHKAWAEDDFVIFSRERLGAPFYEDDRLIAWDVPPPTDPLGWRALIPAPELAAQVDAHLFLPTAEEVRFSVRLSGDAAVVALQVDGQPVTRWALGTAEQFEQQMRLDAGYHTLGLATEPPCWQTSDSTLICQRFRAEIELTPITPP